jgi:AraC-like DNA-binding protein
MIPEAYCLHREFAPEGPLPFQMDRHYLLFASRGTMRLEAWGRRWTLPPARAALIAAGQPVAITILTQLTSASVLFAPSFMPEPPAVTVFDVSPLARALIDECRDYGPEDGPLPSYGQSLFQMLATVAVRLAANPSPLSLPLPTSEPLRRALDLTEATAGDAPVFADIAYQTGQSPRALSRRFAEELGMTWRQALARIRMMQAVEALAGSDMPVTEIAFLVGYNSVSAFNAAFRDLLGVSPTQYRASFHRPDWGSPAVTSA